VNSRVVSRSRNARGEGTRLRSEIVAAAAQILAESGNPDSVTLRAVARRVGISAPSIYAHFPDREAVLLTVIGDAFAELSTTVNAAISQHRDPVLRLRAGCAAYLRFAQQRPQPYRIMFQQSHPLPESDVDSAFDLGAEAFDILVAAVQACIDAGRSTSVDAFADAAAVWVAMHGYSLLLSGLKKFPWPADEAMFERIVLRLAGVTAESAAL
jgi:AcrR family transcriptional regulator